jgi:peptidoglycan/LPS O-acetylase OafA/YrhL
MGTIRLLFAVAVILAHTGPLPIIGRLTNGPVAVEGFFILSGFYMALVLHEKYKDKRTFFLHRLSRIFSGYWVALIVAVFIWRLAGKNYFVDILNADWSAGTKALMLAANLSVFGSDVMLFVYPGPDGLAFTPNFQLPAVKLYNFHYLAAAWSLPVELAFYAVAPFVVKSIPKLVAFALVSLVFRFATYAAFGEVDPWTYRFMPSEMMFFVAGAFGYHAMARLRGMQLHRGFHDVAFTTVLVIIIFYSPIFHGAYEPLATLVPFYVAFSVCLPLIFLRPAGKYARLDVLAGEITYMVYLSHMIVVSNLEALTGIRPKPLVTVALTIAIAVPLHFIAHELDQKFRRWLANRENQDAAVALATNGAQSRSQT